MPGISEIKVSNRNLNMCLKKMVLYTTLKLKLVSRMYQKMNTLKKSGGDRSIAFYLPGCPSLTDSEVKRKVLML